ncbi:protein suppressor 2 of zeste-like [Labrus bergylta]|uniref:protein suppressor 2 of zeste-like n=1 Tax=Labrus bergylta TaxID=56723 RepID=UPI0009B4BF0B|nr:uncharacterized protein LOC114917144 [Labrus bergylta]XP_029135494.1 uncharacterized protein LOC114917144 [Labrus bergylta]
MSGGLQSHSGGSSEAQNTDSENQAQKKPSPVILSLTRCSACYNHKKRSRRDSDGESSSSAEDSGPEVDSESDAESSSSSSSSEKETNEDPPPEPVDTADPDLGDKTGGERQKEEGETSESKENKGTTKSMTRRHPLVKSYSLPSSFPPQLIPWSLLPRPRTVVSTLHLQVLSQKQDDDPFNVMQQHLFEQVKTEENGGEGRQRINNPPYPLRPTMNKLLWRQSSLQSSQQQQPPYPHQQPMLELSHQRYQQQPQHFDPLSAQAQMFPPPPHTLPVLHPQLLHPPIHNPFAPYTHLHASPPQPHWYSMQNPYTH